jgi:1,2-diacylglycerol 3-alpha-glucosyltransferase
MKILLTSDHNPESVNGVIVSVLNLQRELEMMGHDVRLLCLSPTNKSYREKNNYYIESFSLGAIYPKLRGSMVLTNDYIDEIIDWKPDIIHSQCEFFTYSYVNKIAMRTGARIIHTYHTLYRYYISYLLPGLTEVVPEKYWVPLVKSVMRNRLNSADCIIAPTAKTRDELLKGKVGLVIRVIPTGIDLREYDQRLTPEEKRAILDQLAIPEGSLVYGNVGRVAEEKNNSEILQAHKELVKKYPNLYLVFTGDGTYREALEQEVRDLGLEDRVRFSGQIARDQVWKYYQILDLFVTASISETQGLTYIEALANDLPVVARRDRAIDGVVLDGVNGYQYDTVEGLTARVSSLIDQPRLLNQLKQGAHRDRDRFSSQVFGQRVFELYQEVLNREGPTQIQKAAKGLPRIQLQAGENAHAPGIFTLK